MDVLEDDSNLIHSKFRKARRSYSQSVVSRLSSVEDHTIKSPGRKPIESCATISSFATIPATATAEIPSSTAESGIAAEAPTSLSRAEVPHNVEKHEELMHTKIDALPQPSGGLREAAYSSGTKSHLCGTNIIVHRPKSPVQQPSSSVAASNNNNNNIVNNNNYTISTVAGTGGTSVPISSTAFHCEVFRFDSADRERYLCDAISEEEEVFSPGPSPSSSTRSYDSPHIVLDSPRITISPLRITDDLSYPQSNQPAVTMDSQNRLMARVHTGLAMLPTSTVDQSRCLFGVPSSPVSPLTPNTPLSPSPLFSSDQTFQQGFLAELYRRR